MKELITNVLPEIPELEGVNFSAYHTPYIELLRAFNESGKSGLSEFMEFVEEKGGDKSIVGRFLISVFQYLLIRYRRFEDESAEIPAFRVFIILKGWLNEHGFERDYKRLLHSFVGYIVEIAEKISQREDCTTGEAYLKMAYRLALEAQETFGEEYFTRLVERAGESLNVLYERCNFDMIKN